MTMTTGASLHKPIDWHSIKWKKVYGNVRRLQARIVKACQEGNKRKVRALQNILTRSFSGKAMAVRRVTENQGKNTPGVDKEIWNNPEKKTQAIYNLQHSGYRPQPLRRVYIPKDVSLQKFRPLSIPVMKDRAMQALHLLALDPIAETGADLNSYGFRKERSTADAIAQCFNALSNKWSAQYILKIDIKSCFDKISHEWLLSHIPMDKTILRKWLKAGYIYKAIWNETDSGTPQGGTSSPVIMNLTLDGLEKELMKKFYPKGKKKSQYQVNYVRFADDMIVTGRSQELLEQHVKPLIEEFLKQRGLELSQEKTKIVHISEGFDFLGKNIRKYSGKLLIKPAAKNVKAILLKIRQTIKKYPTASVEFLILKLNPLIRGWANYYRHDVSKATFNKIDKEIFLKLQRWTKRRHPKKNRQWIKDKYFKSVGNQNWVFQTTIKNKDGKPKTIRLIKALDVPIKRHIKIKAEANPYDPVWEIYYEERLGFKMLDNLKWKKKLLHLWYAQDGICPTCHQKITKQTGWNIHHIKRRTDGGKETMDNLVLLHPNCHTQVHSQGLIVTKPRSVKRALPDA
ncbi:MAG: group II intron reverse transcriptase/maturase [Acidobacteriota bacterium]